MGFAHTVCRNPPGWETLEGGSTYAGADQTRVCLSRGDELGEPTMSGEFLAGRRIPPEWSIPRGGGTYAETGPATQGVSSGSARPTKSVEDEVARQDRAEQMVCRMIHQLEAPLPPDFVLLGQEAMEGVHQ